MPERTNRRWLIARPFTGALAEDTFRWSEAPAPTPGEGQFLARNLWFSFDPTQVLMLPRAGPSAGPDTGGPLGDVMGAIAVSQVVESRHPGFAVGDLVHGHMGWEDYTVTDGVAFTPSFRLPDGVPPEWALGPFGITGLAAYFGVREVARPKAGETFVISGAAGGVGSIAIQLAKLAGLRTIGIAGGPAKTAWLREGAAADAVIDHRTEDVGARLTALCPDGLDIYFDNSGGPVLDLALERLRPGGRVVLCGGTSRYAPAESPPGPTNYLALVMVNGRMEGILARDYVARRDEVYEALLPLLRSGRLKAPADVLVGLREAPRGLARLYAGENVGKQLLKMDDPPGR